MSIDELYSIKETAEQTGLSEDTIRYYEKMSFCHGRIGRRTGTVYTVKRIFER